MSANDIQIGTAYIPLSKGHRTLVDYEDYVELGDFSWSTVVPNGTHLYAVRYHNGKYTYLHRLIMQAEKGQLVDHINGDTLDNRRANLRLCTKSQNGINTAKAKGVSKFKGVWKSRGTRSKPWAAEIMKDYVKYRLGYFNTEIEAAIAYNKKAVELFGEFAVENKIES